MMFGVKKYYGLRGDNLSYAISFIAGLDFLYVSRNNYLNTEQH
jgi:hypothetical protein